MKGLRAEVVVSAGSVVEKRGRPSACKIAGLSEHIEPLLYGFERAVGKESVDVRGGEQKKIIREKAKNLMVIGLQDQWGEFGLVVHEEGSRLS